MCSSVFFVLHLWLLCVGAVSCERNLTYISNELWNCSEQSLLVVPEPPGPTENILKLDLSYNDISSPFSFEAWANLPLEEINLSYNNLVNVTDFSFINLPKLKLLNLSHNSLIIITDAIVNHLPQLTTLDLSGNIDLGKFKSFTLFLRKIMISNVSFLNLSSIGFDSPPYDLFFSSSRLISLDLSKNCMKVIPKLPKTLQYLDFSHNCIQHIDPDCFDVDTNLKNLSLEYNVYLIDVRPESFNHLVSLTKLSFRGCSHLSRLPGSLFDYNSKLKYLSLAECDFREISVTFKESFLKMDIIDLHDNPWNCSKTIKWFFHLPESTTKNGTLRCAYPGNRSLAEVLTRPGGGERTGRVVLAVCSVLVGVLVVAAVLVAWRTERSRRLTATPYSPLGLRSAAHNQPHPILLTTAV